MGSEKIEGKGKDCSESKKKSRKRQKKKVFPVQKLYETCREVFANCAPGIVPSPSDVQRLKSVLDCMTEEDVGVRPNMPFFKAEETERVPKITYLHIHECEQFSIGIFCLPSSGVIPLHNHPGMTVFSKLLFGNMHIKSYDWVGNGSCDKILTGNPSNSNAIHPAGLRLAKVKFNSNFTSPNTSILYPADGGNMHCFTALTPCAVLDVLGPPYSDPEGRHCAYYLDFPFANISVDGVSVTEEEREAYAWLQERELPEDLDVVGEMYTGPKIV